MHDRNIATQQDVIDIIAEVLIQEREHFKEILRAERKRLAKIIRSTRDAKWDNSRLYTSATLARSPPRSRRSRPAMASKRKCVLCGASESAFHRPLGPHPDGIGPVCRGYCRSSVVGLTYLEAFFILREEVRHLQKIPLEGATEWERAREHALIIALEAMRDFSGSFPPEETLTQESIPAQRR